MFSKHTSNPNSDEEKNIKSIIATTGVLLLIVFSFHSKTFKSVGNPSSYYEQDNGDVGSFENFGNELLTDHRIDYGLDDSKETDIRDRDDSEENAASISIDLNLLQFRVREATALLEEDLRSEYGKYYTKIFEESPRILFQINQVSKDRLFRKMTKKVIEALFTKTSKVPFTWVTAGNSAAAGHGNLFHQSKTYALEKMANMVFSAAGLNFIGKNYAMGQMDSGPELGMCMSSIYGTDIDILAWDFNMTDGHQNWKIALWGARGASHPTRPIQVLLDGPGHRRGYRLKVFQRMEDVGVGLFFMRNINYEPFIEMLPVHGNESNLMSVPKQLKYLVCGGQYEGGNCINQKYNTRKRCPKSSGKNQWNPGWKHHQLEGRIIAHYMISMLNEAVDKLVSMFTVSARDMHDLEILKFGNNWKDKIDNKAWMESASKWPELYPHENKMIWKVVANSFYRGNAICSSALLPSDARYNGLVTGEKGVFGGDYDTGMNQTDAQRRSESAEGLNVSMTVVHSSTYANTACPKYGARDYKDYYYIGKVEDDDVWHTRIFPSDAEYDAFSKGTVSTKNYIMACLDICDEKKSCREGNFLWKDLASIYVDNKKVGVKRKIGKCYILVQQIGKFAWVSEGTKPGQYEIAVKLNGGMFMRITSIVIIPFIL